jgi:hypothetical protein
VAKKMITGFLLCAMKTYNRITRMFERLGLSIACNSLAINVKSQLMSCHVQGILCCAERVYRWLN